MQNYDKYVTKYSFPRDNIDNINVTYCGGEYWGIFDGNGNTCYDRNTESFVNIQRSQIGLTSEQYLKRYRFTEAELPEALEIAEHIAREWGYVN